MNMITIIAPAPDQAVTPKPQAEVRATPRAAQNHSCLALIARFLIWATRNSQD